MEYVNFYMLGEGSSKMTDNDRQLFQRAVLKNNSCNVDWSWGNFLVVADMVCLIPFWEDESIDYMDHKIETNRFYRCKPHFECPQLNSSYLQDELYKMYGKPRRIQSLSSSL